MGDLIERLESASAGSRELDVAIWTTLEPGRRAAQLGRAKGMWPKRPSLDEIEERTRIFDFSSTPRFTTSLDAALALAERVLPEWQQVHMSRVWTGLKFPGNGPRSEVVLRRTSEWAPRATASAATLPLALCIAILRAKAPPADVGEG